MSSGYVFFYIFFSLYRFPVMGHSASSSFIPPAPRRVFWTRQEEDMIQLEDMLTNCDEDFWIITVKQGVSMKKLHLPQGIQYVNLALTAQQGDTGFCHSTEWLNPAFVGDQNP